MEKDWRLVNQERYLANKKLIKRKFVAIGQCDHAHCAFCWDKFGEDQDWLHTGYCTCDGYHWICEHCFQDFKNKFSWDVETESAN